MDKPFGGHHTAGRMTELEQRMPDHLPPQDAAAYAAQYLGQAIILIDRYDLGAEGAYRVSVGGVPYAFKYWSGDQAAALPLQTAIAAHRILHQRGWPLPIISCWHSDPHFAFVLEAQMHGNRVVRVSVALCQQLLALLATAPSNTSDIPPPVTTWVAFLEQSLHDDLPLSPCRPRALERTTLGRQFLARARRTFAAARPALAAANDIIHGDFSAGNILCDDAGSLTAVLDWQHGGIGHRGFDLIDLEWDLALRLDVGSAPALALVTANVDEQLAASVRRFCRAYYGVWNLSWALDTPDEAAVLHAATRLEVA
jgi:aminoglycoside phosphotransferase